MKAIHQYQRRYAEPECRAAITVLETSKTQYDAVLVIPAYDEDGHFIERLLAFTHKILVIIVINQPENTEPSHRNQDLLSTLMASSNCCNCIDNVYKLRLKHLDILVVDRFSQMQIPPKQGVGLARKIGADIASEAIQRGIVYTPWIYSTDADAFLPENYFNLDHPIDPDVSARVFNFCHIDDNSPVALATSRYEQSLKYYVRGLRWANSPYAYPTLGSTLAISHKAYCQVRGFPRRAGGEDFYVLNKLAKVGTITIDNTITINLSPRVSHRVPFGTGPAVEKIMGDTLKGNSYHYYNPVIFEQLKIWLHWIKTDVHQQRENLLDKTCRHNLLVKLPAVLLTAATAINFDDFLQHAYHHCSTHALFMKHFNSWFDAFRTLKFIHYLQEHYFKPTPLTTCLAHANQWNLPNE